MVSAVPSRVSLLILRTQAEDGAYLRDSSRVPRRRPFYFKPPYAIGSVPSLSGHAIAYRWRSLPRVRRHRASRPQGSSERVLPRQLTMDQLIYASLSHTHYWYEVGMLKVPTILLPAIVFFENIALDYGSRCSSLAPARSPFRGCSPISSLYLYARSALIIMGFYLPGIMAFGQNPMSYRSCL